MAYTKRDKTTADSEIFLLKPDKRFKIWFYIVGEVQRKDYKKWKRGENWFSYEKITQATGATKQQIYKCVKFLSDRSMIETHKETRWLTIKVLNYAKYQDIKKTTGDSEETDGRYGGDTEDDTKEEEEKNKEEKKWSADQKDFFWKQYPHARKWKKQDAIKFAEQIDADVFLHMVSIYKWEVAVWMQDAKYVPACERWSRDFVPYSETMQETKLKQIYYKLLDDREVEKIKQFTQDFWEETIMKMYNKRKEEQRNQLLSSMK